MTETATEIQFTADELTGIEAELCRESFFDFIERIAPGYEFNWHHRVLIDALQRLAERKYKRLIVMMPPRHGKSLTVSDLFPAWCLARNADEKVIAASYSLDLASFFNRQCQRTMTGEKYKRLFPETRLKETGQTGEGVRNNHRFDIVGRNGHYVSAGVGGGITGVGATIAIIDDPVKNAAEADSKTYRDNGWEWYTTTFKTRFEPGAVEVICQTRWHEDDLAGRVLAQIKPGDTGTEVVSLPALCEQKEQFRGIGEALWPERFSRDELLGKKDESGSRTWNALYQQRPAPDEGNLIKRDWFDFYDPKKVDLSGIAPNFFFDTAYTDKETNDPTAGIAYVKKGDDYYILECRAEWLEFTEQTEFISDFCEDNGYTRRSLVRVEPKATGKSVVQVLKRQTGLNIMEADAPKESKVSRVNSIAARLEAGRVLLPKGAAWVAGFLDECAAFPNAAHDDRIDCLTGMILNEEKQVRGFRRRSSSIN